ncbi:hypothetical protein [Candidatus Enterococcus willemsii]|uniref:hypothetical protein n=1 Tax=Candidatus Enterococcus willemsii TaxID=1857215 RepID=UPI0013798166|nr:hypothetical protein [Enterococcus sp. CU12B]
MEEVTISLLLRILLPFIGMIGGTVAIFRYYMQRLERKITELEDTITQLKQGEE